MGPTDQCGFLHPRTEASDEVIGIDIMRTDSDIHEIHSCHILQNQ